MIRVLHFNDPSEGERVRTFAWRQRSAISMALACDIANDVRERVATRFPHVLDVWCHAPTVPSPALMAALLAEAELFEIAGSRSRGWLFIDTMAARRLVAAAFAEEGPSPYRPWSTLERQTLECMMRDIAQSFAPLVGTVREVFSSGDQHAVVQASSLLAIRFGAPLDIEVSFALATDPSPVSGATLAPELLDPVALRVRAVAGTVRMSCAELAALEIGAVLPMSKEDQSQLAVDRTLIARGVCGVTGGRLAFCIGSVHESQGA